ncbi:MAG: aldo/keto reductase [Neptuniibacter sp.]
MKRVVVIQARTNSARLPAKVLLPVKGIPLAVLAAKRAGNTGLEVIVATSEEASDDVLVQALVENDIRFYRGSLNNTLDRIVNALKSYSDDTLVFRLTADNVFPDGALLEEMQSAFTEKNIEYLCCNGEKSGLPYGMSAELTRLCHLRDASRYTGSPYDQEHVTPFVRRQYGESYFERYKDIQKGHFRCTVDCLDDYLGIQEVFSEVEDPIHESAFSLVDRLYKVKFQPMSRTAAKKLVLGTAQLGLFYGINNQTGKPDADTAERLIKSAIVNGATFIDTARAYGDSEKVVGQALKNGWQGRTKIVTKLSPLNEGAYNSPETISAFVDASLYKSSTLLGVQSLDVLLLHRASDMVDWDGAAWKRLLEHKDKGFIKKLGLSVQTPSELELALTSHDVTFIQMPFNVLDWRWDEVIPKIIKEKEKRDLTIHVRSALLQGLLLSSSIEHWQRANEPSAGKVISWLVDQAENYGKLSVADFCLNYVKSCAWVDGLVIGMETINQLIDNVSILSESDFSDNELNKIKEGRPYIDKNVLNPTCWS